MLTRLHITGCPRSGTTLLMELMRSCFATTGSCSHELGVFAPVPIADGLFLSKKPTDIRRMHRVFVADPRLHVLHIVRDPRAVICSRHAARPDQYRCNFRIWDSCEQHAVRFEAHPRFLRMRYEQLLADPDGVQREIAMRFDFLRPLHAFSEFAAVADPSPDARRALGGVRPIAPAATPEWHQHLPRIAEQLQRHPELAAALRRLGYEADDSWQTQLEGITPRRYPCRYPERAQPLQEFEAWLRYRIKTRRYLAQLDAIAGS